MSLCGQKDMHVIQSEIPLPTGRGSVKPGRPESEKCPYKWRLNLDNELIFRVYLHNLFPANKLSSIIDSMY